MKQMELDKESLDAVYGEICRFLELADENLKHRAAAGSDYERGLANGKALAYQGAAMRLAELAGLVQKGAVDNVSQEIDWLRGRMKQLAA